MKALTFLALMAVLVISCFAVGQNRNAPPKIYVDEGACPFECCVYRDWIALTRVTLLDRPNGKPITTIEKGDTVRGITGIVYTIPRRVTVVYPYRGHRPGDVFYILTYLGEGFARTWHDGKVIQEDIHDSLALTGKKAVLNCTHASERCWWRMESPPIQRTWWVKVRTADGIVGWAISNGNFGNQDGCG